MLVVVMSSRAPLVLKILPASATDSGSRSDRRVRTSASQHLTPQKSWGEAELSRKIVINHFWENPAYAIAG